MRFLLLTFTMLLAHMDHAQHNFTSGEQILQSIKDRELKRVNSIFKKLTKK